MKMKCGGGMTSSRWPQKTKIFLNGKLRENISVKRWQSSTLDCCCCCGVCGTWKERKRHFRFVMCVVQQYWFWRAFQHHFQLIGFILTILFFWGGFETNGADMWHNTRWQAHSRIAHRDSLEKWRRSDEFAWRCCRWEYGHQFELFQQQPLFIELNMWLMKLHRNLHNVSPFLEKWLFELFR